MPVARSAYDYAIIRVAPRVERGEFINVGAIVFCRPLRFLEARVELDADRLRALDSTLDPAEIKRHLDLIPRIAAGDPTAGPISGLSLSERFHWLTAPRSAMIQISPVHAGQGDDLDSELEELMRTMVRPASPSV